MLIFSVTPFKIEQTIKIKTVQKINSRILGKNEGEYAKTLAKFRSQQFFLSNIWGEIFYSNVQRFVWRRDACAHLDGHQHGGRILTKTSVTEFYYKSVNLSLEDLKNIKIILFLMHELFT